MPITPFTADCERVSILTQTRRLGAIRVGQSGDLAVASFNPHPTRRLGAISNSDLEHACIHLVSILTQPEGWVPSLKPQLAYNGLTVGFNPHPTRRLGAILEYDPATGRLFFLFQSSPNPKVGCHARRCLPRAVYSGWSILTQPEGWVPSIHSITDQARSGEFQSSPNPKVGCHSDLQAIDLDSAWVFRILTQPEALGCHLMESLDTKR